MAAQRVVWTEEMEGQLVELWQANPSLYDVSSDHYHDRNKRDKSWDAIAACICLVSKVVQSWHSACSCTVGCW